MEKITRQVFDPRLGYPNLGLSSDNIAGSKFHHEEPAMTIVKSAKSTLVAVAAACTLAACGGGGDGGSAATSPFAVQGGWQGTASTGEVVQAIVLEDGTLWAIAGPSSGSSFYPTDLFQGTLQASNGTLSSSNLRGYDFATGVSISGSIAGTYVAGTSMTMTATPTGSTAVGVNVSAVATADYDYSQPAQLATLAGSWPGFFSSLESGTVNIQSNGTFTTTTSLGCQINGAATARASGRNVFNVSLTFGAAPCNLPGASGSGIAVITRSGTTSQLTVAVTTADRAYGGAFFGRR